MDLHTWFVGRSARPERVVARRARRRGARLEPDDGRVIEDTVSLTAQWRNDNGSVGVATYVASWIAPQGGLPHATIFPLHGPSRGDPRGPGPSRIHHVHGRRRDSRSEPAVHEIHPGTDGTFAGQHGYGYRSIEEFVEAAEDVNAGRATAEEVSARDMLATVDATARVTAMLEAGRMSLDAGGRGVRILYPSGSGSGTVPSNPSGWNWSERETGSGAKGVAPSVRGCDVGAS